MAHVTPEEAAAFNEVMQLLEAEPVDTTTSTSLVLVTNDDNIPAQREKLQFWFRLENQKKLSVCSSHMIRLNAFQIKTAS